MITDVAAPEIMSRERLKSAFLSVRRRTEDLCKPLATEDYIPQPVIDVSPPKWHLAHTTWFFEKFLLEAFARNYKAHIPAYSYLFNSYYTQAGDKWPRDKRGHLSRPTVHEVYAYRAAINEQMIKFLEKAPEKSFKEISEVLLLGINHEEQHQELLITDIKYIFALNPLQPVYNANNPYGNFKFDDGLRKEYFDVDEGLYTIGHEGNEFAFDNELPAHRFFTEGFRISRNPVSNAAYIEFIADNGYANPVFWLSDGRDWVNADNIQAPLYWQQKDGQWYEMTLNGLQQVVPEAPVTHISYYEADAYAAWAGKRLPAEEEWEIAARIVQPHPADGNFQEDGALHPLPLMQSAARQEVHQLLGDVWEWTKSAYGPYPGYKHARGALGEYNGKFMANQMVLRGGSCATPRYHIRTSYRNFFHPEKQWQFTGIRLVEDLK